MEKGRIAVLVSNDLTFDQRVRKTCAVLSADGWEPVLIGRRMRREDAVSIDRPYRTHRMWLGFQKGPLFYLSLQVGMLRALRRLHREGEVSAVWANDLDTLGPAVYMARRTGWKLAYDSHEWFTEAEGLQGKPLRRAIWRRWEKRCFGHLERMLTVNGAIADSYRSSYGVAVDVVPNVPERLEPAEPMPRSFLGWPEDRTVLLMQGAFMDRDRGALDAVRALAHLKECHLALIGSGPEHAAAADWGRRLGVADRLHVHDRMPFEQLRRCTASADIGLSLDRSTAGNFKFSLPNKLFDYLHAEIPVVCTDLPVAGKLVKTEKIGTVAADAEGDEKIAYSIAEAVQLLLREKPEKSHLRAVAARHHWGEYEGVLLRALHTLG